MVVDDSRGIKKRRRSKDQFSRPDFDRGLARPPPKKAIDWPSLHNAFLNSAERIYWKSSRKSPINGPGLDLP
jgi:hypothetical protein